MSVERREHLREILTKGGWVCQAHLRVVEHWHPEDDRHTWVVIPTGEHVIGYEDLLHKAEETVSGGIVARHYWDSRYSNTADADAARAEAVNETIDKAVNAVEAVFPETDTVHAPVKAEILALLDSLRSNIDDPAATAEIVSRLSDEIASHHSDDEDEETLEEMVDEALEDVVEVALFEYAAGTVDERKRTPAEIRAQRVEG